MFEAIGEGHKILRVTNAQNPCEPYLQIFRTERPKIVLSNSEADQVIIPHDLLPESQQDGNPMIDLVAAVKHLVKTIRTLEAENAELKNQLLEAMEKY